MKERDYINATNLAKVRSAKAVLRDTLPDEGLHDAFFKSAMSALTAWETSLAEVVADDRDAVQSNDCQHKQRISEEAGMGHTTYEVCTDCGKRFV